MLKKQNNPNRRKEQGNNRETKHYKKTQARKKKSKIIPRAARNYTKRHPVTLETGKTLNIQYNIRSGLILMCNVKNEIVNQIYLKTYQRESNCGVTSVTQALLLPVYNKKGMFISVCERVFYSFLTHTHTLSYCNRSVNQTNYSGHTKHLYRHKIRIQKEKQSFPTNVSI